MYNGRQPLPRLGPMHAAALGAAALTSICYIAVITESCHTDPVILLGIPLLIILASSIGTWDAAISALLYTAFYAAHMLHLLPTAAVLPLLPIFALMVSRSIRVAGLTAAMALGLWLTYTGSLELGVGIVAIAAGLSHMTARRTAKGIASASMLYLAALLAAKSALIPVVLLYSAYLYIEERSRWYRPYVDRGLVVAGFATQYLAIIPFLLSASLDVPWMIVASASYFLAAGLTMPRPSNGYHRG